MHLVSGRVRPGHLLLGCVAALVWLVAGCGGDSSTSGDGDPGTTEATSTTSATTTTRIPDESSGAEDVDVRVYFAQDEKVATAGRTVSGPEGARGALEALLEGPKGIETELEMTSAVPEGTELLDVAIADGVATVDLNDAFESGGGSLSMQLRVAQVVFTLTQFDSVDSVRFRIDGDAVDAIGGEGVLVDGVDRRDVTNVTPLILVESPVPGEAVSSPLRITGMSNTFEASVQYSVADGEGRIVDEGFTTATAGSGTFGTFSVVSEFDVDRSGVGAVIVFEESARDGSRTNVYEVPVEVG